MTYSSCCKKSNDCNANVYGDILRVQTIAHLCCALELVGNLEAALQQDACDGETEPSCNVELACQNLYHYLYDNQCHLASLDTEEQYPEDPDQSVSCLVTFGAYRYIDCICKKVPFLWRECALNASLEDEQGEPVSPPEPVKVSIFDLCKPENGRWAYGQNRFEGTPMGVVVGVNIEDYVEAVCCLKNHYLQIKSILEH